MTTRLPPPFDKLRPETAGPSGLDSADLPADPVYGVMPDPDAPDDYEPLPDAMQQEPDFLYAVTALQAFFWGRPGVLVSGDTPVYYIDADDAQHIVRPDCYVAFGVNPISIRRRNGYFIREAGKPPDFVLEIASESTHANDTGPKRGLYARLGVGEYWRFDATGGDLYPEALAGERLADGEYVRIETVQGPDGVIRGHSEWLGLDLCWDNGHLRYYDPKAEEYLRDLQEAETARLTAEGQAVAEQLARQAAEERILQLEEQLRRALDSRQ